MNSAILAWSLAAITLYLKMLGVSMLQGRVRLRERVFLRPEDAAHWGAGAPLATEEHPVVDRAQRTLRNDGENIPIFLALSLAYVLSGASATGAWIYFGLFVASRVVHTLAYITPRQPLRNRAYLLGVIVCLAISVHTLVGLLCFDSAP